MQPQIRPTLSGQGMKGRELPDWLLRFKLDPPVQGAALIPRPRLLQSLPIKDFPRLGIVCGPPGSGKSTALQQLYENVDAGHRAWLTLDEDDADPRRLMTYLLAALESCGITNSGLSAAWRSGMQ